MGIACRCFPADADRDDAGLGLDGLSHGHRDTEDRRLERQGQIVFDHDSEPGQLFAFVVAIDRRLAPLTFSGTPRAGTFDFFLGSAG